MSLCFKKKRARAIIVPKGAIDPNQTNVIEIDSNIRSSTHILLAKPEVNQQTPLKQILNAFPFDEREFIDLQNSPQRKTRTNNQFFPQQSCIDTTHLPNCPIANLYKIPGNTVIKICPDICGIILKKVAESQPDCECKDTKIPMKPSHNLCNACKRFLDQHRRTNSAGFSQPSCTHEFSRPRSRGFECDDEACKIGPTTSLAEIQRICRRIRSRNEEIMDKMANRHRTVAKTSSEILRACRSYMKKMHRFDEDEEEVLSSTDDCDCKNLI